MQNQSTGSRKEEENKMSEFNQEEFNNFTIEHEVPGFFPDAITLKSGRKSNWYLNWRNVAGDAFLTDQLVDYVIAFTKDLGLDPKCFYGVPEGATKLAVLTQNKWAKASADYDVGSHPLAMGRGKPKEHGDPKDKYFVGMPRGDTIVLEDVTTTGGSLLKDLAKLKEAGIPVIAAIGLSNRMELTDDRKSVKQIVEEQGVPYHAMSSALDLLPKAYQKLKPGEDIAKAIEREFEEHGVQPLKLR